MFGQLIVVGKTDQVTAGIEITDLLEVTNTPTHWSTTESCLALISMIDKKVSAYSGLLGVKNWLRLLSFKSKLKIAKLLVNNVKT